MSFTEYSKTTRFRLVFIALAVASAAAFWLLAKSGVVHDGTRSSYVLFLPPAALLFFTTVFYERIRQGHTV